MNPATPGPRTVRPAGAPAYYLGRPASVWIAATRRRRAPAANAAAGSDEVSQLVRISPPPRRSAA